MTTVDPHDPRSQRRLQVVRRAMLVVSVLATAWQVAALVHAGLPPVPVIGAASAVAGHLLAHRLRGLLALPLVAAAPLLAVAGGWEPTYSWTIAVFSAVVLTLRGASGLLVGTVVGAANLAAVAWAGGTVLVHQNPGAAVAGFTGALGAAVGSALRDQDRYLTELHGRTADAIAIRQAVVDQSVAEERVRIARDLHDGIGHHMALISMRLGAAEVRLPAGADAARSELEAARADLQQVLVETQQVLRVLRVDGAAVSERSPSHRGIEGLVNSFAAAGLTVESSITHLPAELPPQTSAAAYRIVEEVLTNAQRHSDGTTRLTVGVDGRELVIESVNRRAAARPARPGTSGGHGLVGLRERAASAGGSLEARPDGELFWVRAVLPLGGQT